MASKESLKIFEDMKATVQNQFQKKEVESPCPNVQTAWEQYNQFVDSIAAMKCELVGADGTGGSGLTPDDLKILMLKARQIDQTVSRWLISTDQIERQDLINDAQNNIKSGNELLGARNGATAEQKRVIALFRSAERYFNRTCLHKKE